MARSHLLQHFLPWEQAVRMGRVSPWAGLAWLRSPRHHTIGDRQQHKCPSGRQPAASGMSSLCVGVFLVCGLRCFTCWLSFLKHTLKNVAVETHVPELPNSALITSSVSAPAKRIWSIIFLCHAPVFKLLLVFNRKELFGTAQRPAALIELCTCKTNVQALAGAC